MDRGLHCVLGQSGHLALCVERLHRRTPIDASHHARRSPFGSSTISESVAWELLCNWPKAETTAAGRGGGFLGWTCRAGIWAPGQPDPIPVAPTCYEKTCKSSGCEQALVSTREALDQPVKIFTALAERLHRDALVLAVDAHVVHVARKPGMPVGRNAGIAQITAVGRGGAHHRNDGHSAPELLGGFLDGAQQLLVERRRCAEHRPGAADHRNLVVAEHANEGSFHVL